MYHISVLPRGLPCRWAISSAGVHLYAQVLVRVDELDEQRKLVAEALVVFFPDQVGLQFGHQLVERLALVLARSDDGLVILDAGNLPAFADLFLSGIQLFERNDFFAAPDG